MNTVSLIGNLVADPEIRWTNGDKQVAKFRLAVANPFNQDSTNFINITAWDKRAEVCEKYLSKGKKVGVTGYIQTGSYERNDGTKVYTTDIVATNLTLITSENTENSRYDERNSNFGTDSPQEEKSGLNQKSGDINLPSGWEKVSDDDIPF